MAEGFEARLPFGQRKREDMEEPTYGNRAKAGPASSRTSHGASATADSAGAMMSLEAIWEARDEAYALLRRERMDAAALASIERTIHELINDLTRSTIHYSAKHGTKTPEGHVALSYLSRARDDLRWVADRHHTAIGVELRDRLQHALRSSVNGLALLRWSRVGVEEG